MKNKKLKLFLLAVSALGLASCSSVGTDMNFFFGKVGEALTPADNGTTETVKKTKLATPTNFTVAADGTYSFTGVANASSYLMYITDPSDTTAGSYLYNAEIALTEANTTYTGKLSDLMTYPYGNYSVKVMAYAPRTSEFSSSDEAVVSEFKVTGALSTPHIAYSYDQDKLTCQLRNSADYALQVTPVINFTFTDNTDSSKSTTASIESMNTSTSNNSSNYVSFENLDPTHSYTLTATAHTDSKLVTGGDKTENVLTEKTFGMDALTTEDYEEVAQQGGPGGGGGGGAGWSLTFTDFSFTGGETFLLSLGDQDLIKFDAVLTTAHENCTYSYKLNTRDSAAPFVVNAYIDFYNNYTFKFHMDEAGPLAKTDKTGTWVLNDTTVNATWNK